MTRKSNWVPKKDFHPGGRKGKLHRELGIPVGEKIGAKRIAKAERSSNPEIARDAKRAETMSHWKKKKRGGTAAGKKPAARADKPRRRR